MPEDRYAGMPPEVAAVNRLLDKEESKAGNVPQTTPPPGAQGGDSESLLGKAWRVVNTPIEKLAANAAGYQGPASMAEAVRSGHQKLEGVRQQVWQKLGIPMDNPVIKAIDSGIRMMATRDEEAAAFIDSMRTPLGAATFAAGPAVAAMAKGGKVAQAGARALNLGSKGAAVGFGLAGGKHALEAGAEAYENPTPENIARATMATVNAVIGAHGAREATRFPTKPVPKEQAASALLNARAIAEVTGGQVVVRNLPKEIQHGILGGRKAGKADTLTIEQIDARIAEVTGKPYQPEQSQTATPPMDGFPAADRPGMERNLGDLDRRIGIAQRGLEMGNQRIKALKAEIERMDLGGEPVEDQVRQGVLEQIQQFERQQEQVAGHLQNMTVQRERLVADLAKTPPGDAGTPDNMRPTEPTLDDARANLDRIKNDLLPVQRSLGMARKGLGEIEAQLAIERLELAEAQYAGTPNNQGRFEAAQKRVAALEARRNQLNEELNGLRGQWEGLLGEWNKNASLLPDNPAPPVPGIGFRGDGLPPQQRMLAAPEPPYTAPPPPNGPLPPGRPMPRLGAPDPNASVPLADNSGMLVRNPPLGAGPVIDVVPESAVSVPVRPTEPPPSAPPAAAPVPVVPQKPAAPAAAAAPVPAPAAAPKPNAYAVVVDAVKQVAQKHGTITPELIQNEYGVSPEEAQSLYGVAVTEGLVKPAAAPAASGTGAPPVVQGAPPVTPAAPAPVKVTVTPKKGKVKAAAVTPVAVVPQQTAPPPVAVPTPAATSSVATNAPPTPAATPSTAPVAVAPPVPTASTAPAAVPTPEGSPFFKTVAAMEAQRQQTAEGKGGYGAVTQMVPTEALLPLREYDRSITPKYPGHLEEVQSGIAQRGITDPVIVKYNPETGKAYLGEGNTRVTAAAKLGMPAVPVRVLRSSVPSEHVPGVEVPGFQGKGHVPEDMTPSDIGLPVFGEKSGAPKAATPAQVAPKTAAKPKATAPPPVAAEPVKPQPVRPPIKTKPLPKVDGLEPVPFEELLGTPAAEPFNFALAQAQNRNLFPARVVIEGKNGKALYAVHVTDSMDSAMKTGEMANALRQNIDNAVKIAIQPDANPTMGTRSYNVDAPTKKAVAAMVDTPTTEPPPSAPPPKGKGSKKKSSGILGDQRGSASIDLLVPGADSIARGVDRAAVYFSQARRTLAEKLPEVVPGKMFRQIINKLPSMGVKPEEIRWTGLDELAERAAREGRKLTREEILAHIDANNIQVREKTLGPLQDKEREHAKALLDEYDKANREYQQFIAERETLATHDLSYAGGKELLARMNDKFNVPDVFNDHTAFDRWFQRTVEELRAKHGTYDSRNGEAEWQVQSQAAKERLDNAMHSIRAAGWDYTTLGEQIETGDSKFGEYTLPGGENYREVLLTWGDRSKHPSFTQSSKRFSQHGHFSESDILAHARVKDRVTPDGKKVLFIEEIQSDWHQKRAATAKEHEWYTKAYELRKRLGLLKTGQVGPPRPPNGPDPAPFEDFENLAAKRLTKMAVDGGYDAIAWTTGEQQQQRYRQVIANAGADGVRYNVETGELSIMGAGQIIDRRTVSLEELPKFVGKSVAERLVTSEPVTDIQATMAERERWQYDLDNLEAEFSDLADTVSRLTEDRPVWMSKPENIDHHVITNRHGDVLGSAASEVEARTLFENLTSRWREKNSKVYDAAMEKSVGLENTISGLKQKIAASAPTLETSLESGVVSREGMVAFYDKRVVNAFERIGKKFGARPGKGKVVVDQEHLQDKVYAEMLVNDEAFEGRLTPEQRARLDSLEENLNRDRITEGQYHAGVAELAREAGYTSERGLADVHMLEVTPELREGAAGGFPLFALLGAMGLEAGLGLMSDTKEPKTAPPPGAQDEELLRTSPPPGTKPAVVDYAGGITVQKRFGDYEVSVPRMRLYEWLVEVGSPGAGGTAGTTVPHGRIQEYIDRTKDPLIREILERAKKDGASVAINALTGQPRFDENTADHERIHLGQIRALGGKWKVSARQAEDLGVMGFRHPMEAPAEEFSLPGADPRRVRQYLNYLESNQKGSSINVEGRLSDELLRKLIRTQPPPFTPPQPKLPEVQ